jgi:hypothetical protein
MKHRSLILVQRAAWSVSSVAFAVCAILADGTVAQRCFAVACFFASLAAGEAHARIQKDVDVQSRK